MVSSLLAFALLATSFELEMSPQDQRDTGIYKLSEKEKGALQEWVKNNYTKPAAAPNLPKQKNPSLVENLNNGSYLRLTDGSIWNIRPQDTLISQGWITEVEVVITPSSDLQYPYKLTNSLSKSSVLAKKITSIPKTPPAPVNPPSNNPNVPTTPSTPTPATPRK